MIAAAPTTAVAEPAKRTLMRQPGQAVAYASQEFQTHAVELSAFRKLGDDILAEETAMATTTSAPADSLTTSTNPTATATATAIAIGTATVPTTTTIASADVPTTTSTPPSPTTLAATTAPTSQPAELSDNDRVHRFLSYLRKHFTYTLDNRDEDPTLEPVMNFLLNRKRGHCEYFASALVLLCQAQGIPARIVVGFKGGEYNTFGNYYLVRNCDAHAWSEIYIRDMGWVRFDPTPPTRDTLNVERENHLTKLFWDVVDLMRFSWITRVTTTGGDNERRKFLNRMRNQLPGKDKPGEPEGPTLRERLEKIYSFIRGEGYQNRLPQTLHWILVVLVFVLAICVAKIAILLIEKGRQAIRQMLYHRRLMRFGAAWQCPVDFYRKTLLTLANYGMVRATTQTAEEFAEFVGSEHECIRDDFDAITREYLEVRFGGHPLSDGDRRVVSLAMQSLATRLHEKHRPEEELTESQRST
jgi:transglutaminase-like putative cysteine protease